jgi:hypothetical protein
LELPASDAVELERITREQAGIQKQLEQSRKLNKQHGMLIQVNSSRTTTNNCLVYFAQAEALQIKEKSEKSI